MKLKYYLFVLIGILFSCSEKYEPYNSETNRLGFYYGKDTYGTEIKDSVVRYTFAFYSSAIQSDTVWLTVNTMGYVTDTPREFELEQIMVNDVENAVAGTHFKALSDPKIKKHLIIAAGSTTANIPIVVLRDPSLTKKQVTLKLKIKLNKNFDLGYTEKQVAIVEFADIIVKPKGWNGQVEYHFGGPYSFDKFKFMIEKATWIMDEEWFKKNFEKAQVVDMGYAAYVSGYFVKAIKEENKARRAEGLDVLRETPTESGIIGKPIQFYKYNVAQPYEYEY